MKERPIIFSDAMVRAILEGKKTQTRRKVKPQPEGDTHIHLMAWDVPAGRFQFGDGRGPIYPEISCPHGRPGDRLWVREAWAESGHQRVEYRAHPADGECFRCVSRWRSPLHMPRWASRITLEITDVRVERVQDISEDDAKAEGLSTLTKDNGQTWKWGIPDRDGLPGNDDDGWHWHDWSVDPRKAFAKLWDSIHGPGAWSSNPWVWVLTFKRIV